MATAEQIKSLIRSHFSDQPDQFFTTALQVAAHEARKGHSSLAHEIRNLVDKAKSPSARVIPFTPDLDHLVVTSSPVERIGVLVQSEELRGRIERILREYRQKTKRVFRGLSLFISLMLNPPPSTQNHPPFIKKLTNNKQNIEYLQHFLRVCPFLYLNMVREMKNRKLKCHCV